MSLQWVNRLSITTILDVPFLSKVCYILWFSL